MHGQMASRDMIVGWIHKCESSGSVTDMVHGALRIVRADENLDRVRETCQCSPRHYARQQSHILGGTRWSLGLDVPYLQAQLSRRLFGVNTCLGWSFVTRRWVSSVKMPVLGIAR